MPLPLSRWVRAALVAVLAVFLVACGEGAASKGGGILFSPAQVTVQKVAPASYPVTFEYVGQAVGSKDAEVRARVTGIVERRDYQEGATVKAGALLFEIDARPY